jgi:hypothetical protein
VTGVQSVWLIETLVEERQAAIRREVTACRRRRPQPPGPRQPWRVRLGWRLVEVGLRLALGRGAHDGRLALRA